MHALRRPRAGLLVVGRDHGRETRLFELQRRQFHRHRRVERLGRLPARQGQFGGAGAISRLPPRPRRWRARRAAPRRRRARRDLRRIFGPAPAARRPRAIFARGGAQSEQALLDPLQRARIEFGVAQGLIESLLGMVERGERRIQRFQRRRRSARGACAGAALEPAQARRRAWTAASRRLRRCHARRADRPATFSACSIAARSAASASSSPGRGPSFASSAWAWRR